MFSVIKKSLLILGEFKSKLPLMFLLFLLVSILDVLSIGLVGPFVALIGYQGSIVHDYPVLLFVIGEVDNNSAILSIGIFLVMVFFVKSLVAFFVQKKILSFGYVIRTSLINNLVKAYQSMRYEDVLNKDSSEMIVSTNTHVGLFVDSVFVPALRVSIELLVIFGIILLMSFTSLFAVTGLLIILSLVLAVYFRFIKHRLYHYGKIMSDKEASIIGEVRHVIGAFREIRLLGVELFFRDEIKRNVVKFGEAGVITRSLHLVPRFLVETSMVVFIVLMIVYMSLNSDSNTHIFATLSVFAVGAIRLVPSISQIGLGYANIKTGMYALDSLYEELISSGGVSINVEDVKDDLSIGFAFNKLELKNVSFSYNSKKRVEILKNVNLVINKGEFVGIVGVSGSGKSTLMDIMLGMIEPTKGSIWVNNMECTDRNLKQWQSKCAYIPQNVFLINASIKKNIALGLNEDKIDDQKLNLAIKAASVERVIMQDGLDIDSSIGEEGVRLSGGQKQRIALARVLYAGREVIFLDEATSALDKAKEYEVVTNILSLYSQITIVLITHNESALKRCNRIYRVINGKVV